MVAPWCGHARPTIAHPTLDANASRDRRNRHASRNPKPQVSPVTNREVAQGGAPLRAHRWPRLLPDTSPPRVQSNLSRGGEAVRRTCPSSQAWSWRAIVPSGRQRSFSRFWCGLAEGWKGDLSYGDRNRHYGNLAYPRQKTPPHRWGALGSAQPPVGTSATPGRQLSARWKYDDVTGSSTMRWAGAKGSNPHLTSCSCRLVQGRRVCEQTAALLPWSPYAVLLRDRGEPGR